MSTLQYDIAHIKQHLGVQWPEYSAELFYASPMVCVSGPHVGPVSPWRGAAERLWRARSPAPCAPPCVAEQFSFRAL